MATKQAPAGRMTPLWLISVFLSVAETAVTFAVTRAAGGVQVALTCFAIAFPLLVAIAFFVILWSRPYVLYPPGEFSDIPVDSFVAAMRGNKVELPEAAAHASIAAVEAALEMRSHAAEGRLMILEDGFQKLLESQESTRTLLTEYNQRRADRESAFSSERTSFEQNSNIKIELAAITGPNLPFGAALRRVDRLGADLSRSGFVVSTRGWNGETFLSGFPHERATGTLFLIHRNNDPAVVARVENVLRDLAPATPLVTLTTDAAAKASNSFGPDWVIDDELDVAVAYAGPAGAEIA